MDDKKLKAVLFDFDGVVMDTENQYTIFWNEQGLKYLGEEGFGPKIKGQTLAQILERYFSGMEKEQEKIVQDLNRFEKEMDYDYFPGIEELLADLKTNGVKTALVTSSDNNKMANVYKAHPEVREQFDCILTAEYFTRSKPDPECFLLGMKLLDAAPGETIVFEDSFHGLQAGTTSGATVIAMATTNSRESLAGKANYIFDNFDGLSFEKLEQLV